MVVILGCQPVLRSPGPAALGWAALSGVGGLTGTMALDCAQDRESQGRASSPRSLVIAPAAI